MPLGVGGIKLSFFAALASFMMLARYGGGYLTIMAFRTATINREQIITKHGPAAALVYQESAKYNVFSWTHCTNETCSYRSRPKERRHAGFSRQASAVFTQMRIGSYWNHGKAPSQRIGSPS
jgi:hypothetical protein